MPSFRRLPRTAALLLALVLCLSLPGDALAWGGDGHMYVARLAVDCLPESPLKDLLRRNTVWFAVNANYPDRWRNRPDFAENARHFLDVERFGHGRNALLIPQEYGRVVASKDYDALRKDGLLPWTVGREYELLVQAMRDHRWEDVMVQAAYLGHYVADAHVPFHATENYDGQISDPPQRGVHARFEETVLAKSIAYSDLTPGSPVLIHDPVAQSFLTLQDSVSQVDALLAADRTAAAASDGAYDDTYWSAFLPTARPIALNRLNTAGRTLAGYLLAAWTAAGKPTPPDGFYVTDTTLPYAPLLLPRGQPVPPAPPVVPGEVKDDARSNVKTIQVHSRILNRDVPVNVLLPTGYEAIPQRRFAVLYLLHGSSGSFEDWNRRTGIAAYNSGRPLILVMPDACGDSWYINSSHGGRVEDFYVHELVPVIDRTYRTIRRREGRVVAGNSMGGYGAWRLALDHPREFGAAAALSGAFVLGDNDSPDPDMPQFFDFLYGGAPNPKTYPQERLLPRVLHLIGRGGAWQGPALYFDIGADDPFDPSNRTMEQALLTNHVPYEFAEFKGGHDWSYWDEHSRDLLQWAQRHIAQPEVVVAPPTQAPMPMP
jgi:enterochelin esterase-like enzyme